VYLWGAQLEEGSFPTSYIPTTTAAVTRAADVASISGSNFSGWYRQEEGTVLIEYIQGGGAGLIAQLSDGTSSNRVGLQNLNGTTPRWFQVASGSSEGAAAGVARTPGAIVKHAVGMKLNDFRAAYDGLLTNADTSISLPTFSQFNIGRREIPTEFANVQIHRLTYWPTRLGNEVLQTITQ
jgi:hypothetical protein